MSHFTQWGAYLRDVLQRYDGQALGEVAKRELAEGA